MSRLELTSQVLITAQIEETIKALEAMQSDERIVKIVKEDNFLVEDAARLFSPIVQNKLLKVIEEPPPNKEFILITPSKATILATIRSRLPIQVLIDIVAQEELGLDISQLSLETVYAFVQEHKRTAAAEMKRIVEEISKEAMRSGKFNLDDKTLTLFSNAFMALDMGSPPTFVLNTLLLKLLAKKKR